MNTIKQGDIFTDETGETCEVIKPALSGSDWLCRKSSSLNNVLIQYSVTTISRGTPKEARNKLCMQTVLKMKD
jgi:hypothetical protein